MQQDADLLNALRTDLAELTALHASSGAEQPVIARLRDLFTPLVDAVSIDHMGNLTATREVPFNTLHQTMLPAVQLTATTGKHCLLLQRFYPTGILESAEYCWVRTW
jgi:hypothetical protein